MNKINRLKELEKIADQLGIGQKREVECVSCHKKIQFKNAIIITNKKVVKYLCQECNKKIEKGDLNKREEGWREIVEEMQKEKKVAPLVPDRLDPKRRIPEEFWNPYPDPIPYQPPYTIEGTTYTVSSSKNETLLKFEPNYANTTSK